VIVLLVLQPLPLTVHWILFVPLLKPITLLLDKFTLLAGMLPNPVVTLHAPMVPALGATACKFIVVLHTVWLFAVMIEASTDLFTTVILPSVVQPLRVPDHWKVLGPLLKPLTLGVLVFAFAMLIEFAPAVFVQFHIVLPVTVLPNISWALALKLALAVQTV
jgi:hypothetical protein